MADRKVDFDTEWAKAVAGFDIILNAIDTGKGINQKEWMNYYKFGFPSLSRFVALYSSSRSDKMKKNYI
jgi:hypothetical protein